MQTVSNTRQPLDHDPQENKDVCIWMKRQFIGSSITIGEITVYSIKSNVLSSHHRRDGIKRRIVVVTDQQCNGIT